MDNFSESVSTSDDGGPAFPALAPLASLDIASGEITILGGMSLRDWFAGQALASGEIGKETDAYLDYARCCYAMADAMLKERGK